MYLYIHQHRDVLSPVGASPIDVEADLARDLLAVFETRLVSDLKRLPILQEPDFRSRVSVRIPLDVGIETLQAILRVVRQAEESWGSEIVTQRVAANPEALGNVWAIALVLVVRVHLRLVADGRQLQLEPENRNTRL